MSLKHSFVGLLMILFLYVLGFVQSCCPNEGFYIFSIELKAREIAVTPEKDSIYVDIDELLRPFKLLVYTKTKEIASFPSAIQSAYARKCPYPDSHNDIILTSLSLSLNKPFEFNGDTIKELTNLLDVSNSGIALNSSLNPAGYSFVDFEFTQSFFDQSNFEPGEYTFYVTGKTSDDIPLAADITLIAYE